MEASVLMPSFSNAVIDVKLDTEPFERGMRVAPVATYFWLRDAYGQAFGKHRQQFLRQTGVRFRAGRSGIKVPPVNKEPHRSNHVTYSVTPTEQRRADAPIAQLHGQAFATSEALESLEKGSTILPRNATKLALPIQLPGQRRIRRGPRALARSLPKKSRLITIERNGKLFLAERIRERKGTRVRAELTKTGKVRKRQRATIVERLIPRYLLVDKVKLPAALGFYRSWDDQLGVRTQIVRRAADRLIKDIARGVTT